MVRWLVTILVAVSVLGCDENLPLSNSDAAHAQTKPTGTSFKGESGITWTEGKEFVALEHSHRTAEKPVKVLEFFQYACGHCNATEPWVIAFDRGKAKGVELEKIPVTYSQKYVAHARLFYTLQALGRYDPLGPLDLHHEVYDTIHRVGDMLVDWNDEKKSFAMQLEWANRRGISADDFTNAYWSSLVDSKVKRAEAETLAYRIQGTPTFIVAGKYQTDAGMAGSEARLLALLTDLSTREVKTL